MGSMGSISPFIGVQDGGNAVDGVPEGYHTMKYPIDRQSGINDPSLVQQLHYSQLQQMHINNVNPMFFNTGEVI